ncbi:MAG: hypothetical protein WCA27_31485 [Candidatus Sulfotelmatobacter sp.]|jgi:hypothetical protein
MPGPVQFGRICRACGRREEDVDAERCASCGADLNAVTAQGTRFIDEDPRLQHVDANNRVELDRFNRLEEAELACGLLRFNGIPCELSSTVIPGLPADTILWVHTDDAKLGWALLADMEREARRKDNDVA